MPQVFNEDFGILYWAKNAKTNNNVVGHHLVSRRLISTPLCIDAPKGPSYYPQNIMF